MARPSPTLRQVLASASRLQELVPDAVMVGGSAAAWHAGHRDSFDHDHVLADLDRRFDLVLEALESQGEWVTNPETAQLSDQRTVTVPTLEETLRVKAFLIVRRNRVRDYLDVVALSGVLGPQAGVVLAGIDAYYGDQHDTGNGVASQVARQLADPQPADPSVTRELPRCKNLDPRWHDWSAVVAACRRLATSMLEV